MCQYQQSTKKVFYLFFLKYFFFSFYSKELKELNIINNLENKKKQELLDKGKKYMQKVGAIVAGVFTVAFIKIFMDKKKEEKPEPKRKDKEIKKPYSYKEKSSIENPGTPPESPINENLNQNEAETPTKSSGKHQENPTLSQHSGNEYSGSQGEQPLAESSNISSTEMKKIEEDEEKERERLEQEMKKPYSYKEKGSIESSSMPPESPKLCKTLDSINSKSKEEQQSIESPGTRQESHMPPESHTSPQSQESEYLDSQGEQPPTESSGKPPQGPKNENLNQNKAETPTISSGKPPQGPINEDSQRKQPPAESSNISSTEIEEREEREELEKEMRKKIEFLLQYYNMSQEFITKLLTDENIKNDIRKIEDIEIIKESIITNNDINIVDICQKSIEIRHKDQDQDIELVLVFYEKILNIYNQVILKEKPDEILLELSFNFKSYKQKSILAEENKYIKKMNQFISHHSLSINEKQRDFMTIYNLIPFCFHTFITFFEFAKDPDELLKNVYSLMKMESLNDESKEIFENLIQEFKAKSNIIVNTIKNTIANKNLNEQTSAEQIIKISKILWITYNFSDMI